MNDWTDVSDGDLIALAYGTYSPDSATCELARRLGTTDVIEQSRKWNEAREALSGVRTLSGIGLDGWRDNGMHFTCTEVEAIHTALNALDLPEQAEALMQGHIEADEEGDDHWEGERVAQQPEIDNLRGELYCDYCEREGHTFRACPRRDDDPDPMSVEDWEDERPSNVRSIG